LFVSDPVALPLLRARGLSWPVTGAIRAGSEPDPSHPAKGDGAATGATLSKNDKICRKWIVICAQAKSRQNRVKWLENTAK
jgi:hypothetical protein